MEEGAEIHGIQVPDVPDLEQEPIQVQDGPEQGAVEEAQTRKKLPVKRKTSSKVPDCISNIYSNFLCVHNLLSHIFPFLSRKRYYLRCVQVAWWHLVMILQILVSFRFYKTK